jgi:hypothetical protein
VQIFSISFPIYEERIRKDFGIVYKVRLVIDGSKQPQSCGRTYAETPNRDELRIYMHIVE